MLATSRPTVLTALRRSISSKPCTKYTSVTHPEEDTITSTATQKLIADHSQYITKTYARPPIVISKGKGNWIWDLDGRKYLDFASGIAVTSLGHCDEGVKEVLTEQSGILFHTSNVWWNNWAGELAKLIVELTKKEGGLGFAGAPAPGGTHPSGAKVFFANSGTEANEGALKFARKYGKETWATRTKGDWKDSPKYRIVCFENGFHGRSMGSLSATTNPKYQLPFTPLIPGFDVGRYGNSEDVQRLVGEDTCAVLVEPIQGEGGVNSASEEFLRNLRRACDRVGALLIYDEIQCGLYRTGSLWAHSTLPTDCHPDIVTMAKALANGFPIGAVLVKDKVADVVTAGSHGTTFGGSPIATRLGHHVLSRLSQPSFTARVKETSVHLNHRISLLPDYFPSLIERETRGRGLIRGIPFKNHEHPAKVVKMARERGLLVLVAGSDAVRLVPSLIVGKEEVDMALDIIESCLSVI